MERVLLVLVSIAWVGGLAALGFLALSADDDDEGLVRTTRAEPRPPPADRGCGERTDGNRLTPVPGRDTVIGPVTLVDAAAAYRSSHRTRRYVTPDYLPGLNAHPMKALALVEPGARVRLVVPRRQRSWMRLFLRDGDDSGQHAVTLQACRRPAATQFEGGVYVDFENAPQGGRCAVLEVQVPGAAMSYRGRAFGPRRGECRELAVRVGPHVRRPKTVLTFRFRSATRLGTSGRRRRAYRLAVLGPDKPACVTEHEAFANRGRRGQRLLVRLDPRRAKGGQWCSGRFRGRLIQYDTHACPTKGVCRRPANFTTRERELARFYFTVR